MSTGKKKPSGVNLTPGEREQLMLKLAEFYMEGKPAGFVCEVLNISANTYGKYLKKIKKAWQERYTDAFNERVNLELARIDRTEAEAWTGWRNSCQKWSKVTNKEVNTERGFTNSSEESYIDKRDGNPNFLNIVLKCVEMRLKIMGVNAKPDEPTNNDKSGSNIRAIAAESIQDEFTSRILAIFVEGKQKSIDGLDFQLPDVSG